MTLPKYYNTGTASVANGATAVTGTGTAWLNLISAGDVFRRAGHSVRVASVASNGALTLAEAWPGTSLVGSAYEIAITYDGPEFQLRTRELLEQLNVLETSGRGIVQKYSTAITDADPGAGYFRLNHGTMASVTAGYLDNEDIEAANITAEIDSWDDSTSTIKGRLWVRSIAVPGTFYAFNVTGSVVDGTGYRKLTLAYVGGAGTLAADDEVMLFFSRTGDKGETGIAGGITLTFDDPTADADPGAGKFRLSHATHASATAAYIDNAEALASADISGFLDSWDDSTATIKGTLIIVSKANAAIFRIYNVTGSVVDGTGYRKVPVAYVAGAGTLADETSCSLFFARTGNNGTNGTNGASALTVVRVVDTTGAAVATAYENGDTIDGVVLVTGDLVLRATSGGNAADGVYIVPASGAAARHGSFDTYDEHPGCYFSVTEGTTNADTLWRCTSNKGGTLGTTALVFAEAVTEAATNAEFLAQSAGNKAVTPANEAARPAFRANKNGVDQTPGAVGGVTKVTYTNEAFDRGGYYDAANSKWTPPAGLVVLHASGYIFTDLVDGSQYILLIYKNGAEIARGTGLASGTSGFNVQVMVFDISNGTDYYEVYVYTQAATNKVYGGSTDTWFEGYFL